MSEPESIEPKQAQVFVLPTSPISQPLLSNVVSPKSDSSEFPATIKGPNWKQKIGRYGIFVVGFGTVAIIGGIAFLAFLWAGIQDQTISQSLRRKIITSNRLAISITLTSLVIRIAVTLQAGVFTSMFAAFLLEYGAISRHAVPELSIMRSSSTGPYYMTWLLAKELSTRKAMVFTLGLILATTTFLSQFTSTVLLSDLNPGEIANVSTIAFARSPNASSLLAYSGSDYWSNRLGAYPVFAEYSEPRREQDGVVDTGLTIRALLPYTRSEERTKLRAYSGMATVIDVRTVCTTTSITDAVISSGPEGSRLIGTVAFPMSDDVRVTERTVNSTFSCVLAARSDVEIAQKNNERASSEWSTTLCRVLIPPSFSEITFFRAYSGGFFILNTTSSPQLSNTSIPTNHTVKKLKNTGPWTSLYTTDLNYTLAISLCLTPSYSSHTGVNITSDEGIGRRTEPSVTWNTTTETFNTAAVRHQLGVFSPTAGVANATEVGRQLGVFSDMSTRDSYSARNILKLDEHMNQTATGSRYAETNERSAIEVYKFIERKTGAVLTAAMCAFCKYDDSAAFAVHNVLVAVFQDILATTNNPALALQAHYHALLAMAYYDFLPEADVTTNATTISQVDLLMPTSRRGFTAVVVVLYTHLVCAVFAIMLFVSGTKLSRLGDGSWMAVAQVAAGDVSHVVTGSTRLGDGEVKRRIRGPSGKNGGRDRDLRLGRLHDGRIGFVPAGPSQTSLRSWLF